MWIMRFEMDDREFELVMDYLVFCGGSPRIDELARIGLCCKGLMSRVFGEMKIDSLVLGLFVTQNMNS